MGLGAGITQTMELGARIAQSVLWDWELEARGSPASLGEGFLNHRGLMVSRDRNRDCPRLPTMGGARVGIPPPGKPSQA